MATAGKDAAQNEANRNFSKEIIIYVLGGPGSGKGTQCSNIVSHYGFCHLGTGELLQAEVQSGSEYGTMIQDFKKEGKLVPTELVVRLLKNAMETSKTKKFLIDGFPRNQENLDAAENILKVEPDMVLYFDCTEEELTRRLLNRNQVACFPCNPKLVDHLPDADFIIIIIIIIIIMKGRVDDNIETIQKRLKVYFECTLPVINYYSKKGKVCKIDAHGPVEEVFEAVKSALSNLNG